MVWLADYEAWGNTAKVVWHEQAIEQLQIEKDYLQPIRFQGQYVDTETGLHYNRFRYYDADVGMFVSRDPIGLLGGNNVFQYAPNPTGWIDPWGLSNNENLCCGNQIPSDLPSNIEEGKQGKHIIGHNNFIKGKSYLYDDVSPQELLDGVHKGDFPIVSKGARGNPVVNFGKPIGVDANSGLSTQFGQIHYGKKGAHIVPHNPTLLE